MIWETMNGEIDVIVSTLRWEENEPQVCYYHEFTAHSWKYTEKGYFFVEEYHPSGYDGAPGELAFRGKTARSDLSGIKQEICISCRL